MIPLREFRNRFENLGASPNNTSLHYIRDTYNIDFDVFLPTIGENLQRNYVWSELQKKELIMSVLIERNIPTFAAVVVYDVNYKNPTYQIIDGKQRLSTLFDFVDNKFSINIDGADYFYKDMDAEYQRAIYKSTSYLKFHLVYSYPDAPITDLQKFNWFKFLSFAGTQQDMNHFENLNNKINAK